MADQKPNGLNESVQRVGYAAKLAELQYLHAVEVCTRIQGSKPLPSDPAVLGVLHAIATNYSTLCSRW